MLPDVITHQSTWEDDYLLPPTVPGLGIEFDRDAAAKHPYRPFDRPQLRRLDGSFTNW